MTDSHFPLGNLSLHMVLLYDVLLEKKIIKSPSKMDCLKNQNAHESEKEKQLHSPFPTKSVTLVVENRKFNCFSWALSTL